LRKPDGTGELDCVVMLTGGKSCKDSLRLIVAGSPTSGAAELNLTTPNGQLTFAIPFDSTAAAIKTLIEDHEDWEEEWEVTARFGPLPDTTVILEFAVLSLTQLLGADEILSVQRFQPSTLEGGARIVTRIEVVTA
jgi:hypothetical protein